MLIGWELGIGSKVAGEASAVTLGTSMLGVNDVVDCGVAAAQATVRDAPTTNRLKQYMAATKGR
jgi:hypothetical protein